VIENAMLDKIRRGEPVFGQMLLELFTPGVPAMLANCGLDFVLFDMEHGRCDLALVAGLINSARGSHIVPLVRVPDVGFTPLSRVLDIGALGVMAPRVETGEQMRDIISQLKYAPTGRRGVALGIAHDSYKASGPSYFEEANSKVIVLALVETVRAFENLDDIVSTPGLDVAWMGHYDLTVSMGIPAQFDHPRFLDAMEQLLTACRRHRVAAGFLPATPADTIRWVKKGFRVISLGSDIGSYQGAVRSFHEAVRAGLLNSGD
jgi:2-keto-3-deoxy-L-rhamnonate aldolase RhmA